MSDVLTEQTRRNHQKSLQRMLANDKIRGLVKNNDERIARSYVEHFKSTGQEKNASYALLKTANLIQGMGVVSAIDGIGPIASSVISGMQWLANNNQHLQGKMQRLTLKVHNILIQQHPELLEARREILVNALMTLYARHGTQDLKVAIQKEFSDLERHERAYLYSGILNERAYLIDERDIYASGISKDTPRDEVDEMVAARRFVLLRDSELIRGKAEVMEQEYSLIQAEDNAESELLSFVSENTNDASFKVDSLNDSEATYIDDERHSNGASVHSR